MAVFQEKNKKNWTKDGRSWGFKVWYTALTGQQKQKRSKLYFTKGEAKTAERQFLLTLKDKVDDESMKFKDLYLAYYEYQKNKVKETTFQTYLDRVPHLKCLDNIKLVDFSIKHYELWKNEINSHRKANGDPFDTSTKNDILKFLKAILNYGKKYYNYNFSSTYNKMENFTNPNEIKKEMLFWTKDEFDKFINFETDPLYICLYELLYYNGLRNGEMRGLTWENIDFDKEEVNINRQVPTWYSRKNWKFTPLKTKSSKRILPISEPLLSHLKNYYKEISKYTNFKDSWFVFSDALPIVADNPGERLKKICATNNLKAIRIHDMRHSCASFLINQKFDITVVAKYLGHSKIEETLNTYAHMYGNSFKLVADTITNINKKSKSIEVSKTVDNAQILDYINLLTENKTDSNTSIIPDIDQQQNALNKLKELVNIMENNITQKEKNPKFWYVTGT